MSMNDPIAAVLSKIHNAEKNAKNECTIEVASKLIMDVLEVMKDHGFVGAVDEVKNPRKVYYKINLLGKINKCNAIKPMFTVKIKKMHLTN